MLRFPCHDAANKETGSWSANPNAERTKVLAQLTDLAGSQSRAVLDVVDAALLVQHLLSACQAVLDPNTYPSRYPGTRWQIKRQGNNVQVVLYDDILPPETTEVTMSVFDVTEFAERLTTSILTVQRAQNTVLLPGRRISLVKAPK